MKKLKVLLATPVATTEEMWGQFKKGGGALIPLGLLSIAGVAIKHGFEVKICDASNLQMNRQQFEDYLLTEKFDVIGLGNCYTSLAHLVFKTALICRDVLPGSKIILGGIHPTIFPHQTFEACPQADFVVYGEGEFTFLELLEFFQSGRSDYKNIQGIIFKQDGGICQTNPRPLIEDLGELPELPFDLLPMNIYVPPPSNYKRLPTYGLLIQRGCPYGCIYCDSRIHGKKIRHYNLDKFIAQLRYLVDKYKMKGIVFQDSVFTINKAFVMEFCKRLISENIDLSWTCSTRVDCVDQQLLSLMKKAGCWGLSYGLESANEESLKMIRKGANLAQNIEAIKMAKAARLQVIGSFILCLPGEDEPMVKKTINFAIKNKLDTAIFFLPVPFPGTELYEICKNEKGLVDNIQWEDYRQWMDQSRPLYINPKIGKEKMVELYNYAVRSFYLSPNTLFKSFLRIRSLSDFRRYFTGFKSISGIIWRSFG